ncbi:MAG: D-xylose ABC transporter ATP-binding protein, partial [Mesorhizobium sp.]
HNIIGQLVASGMAVVMISSELPEVLAVSDRIVTMRKGRITGQMPGVEANEERLMELMALDRQDTPAQDAGGQAR